MAAGGVAEGDQTHAHPPHNKRTNAQSTRSRGRGYNGAHTQPFTLKLYR